MPEKTDKNVGFSGIGRYLLSGGIGAEIKVFPIKLPMARSA
jgi:hypothetical protein